MSHLEQRTVLAWCDLETTGLKPVKNHRILEYAVVFTDLKLNELGSIEGVIPQYRNIAENMMDPYVVDMHTKNGLLGELTKLERAVEVMEYSDTVIDAQNDILQAMDDVRDYVTDYEVETIFVIAGNTIGFDKGYIEYHMPALFERLHYRQLDVSSYKVGFPKIFGTGTSDAHRAMADIRDSIEQHRKMRRFIDAAAKLVGVKLLD